MASVVALAYPCDKLTSIKEFSSVAHTSYMLKNIANKLPSKARVRLYRCRTMNSAMVGAMSRKSETIHRLQVTEASA